MGRAAYHPVVRGKEYKKNTTAPHLYNTQSGVPPREAPFRAIDLGEVALRPHPT